MIGDKPKKSVKKTVITVTITCILTCGCMCLGLFIGGKLNSKRVAVDFTIPEETEDSTGHRYPFLTKQLSNYICGLCSELDLDPNLVVGILISSRIRASRSVGVAAESRIRYFPLTQACRLSCLWTV